LLQESHHGNQQCEAMHAKHGKLFQL